MDTLIQSEDYRYFIEKPNKNFSPQRNKAIIQETIQETDKYFRGIGKVIDDNLGERIDLISTYATKRLGGGMTKSFADYVGKETISRLIGEKILEKIKVAESVNRLNGNRKDLILL
jgi:hypothetical protein